MEITGLSASLVAHRQWPLTRWFRAPSRRYYHRPGLTSGFLSGKRSYERLDPDLQALCRLLHRKGIGTTASCAGHDHDRAYFARRWDALCREAERIRMGGVVVEESETGLAYLLRDPHYQLAWDSFNYFWQDSHVHQSTGYIGIVAPSWRHAVADIIPRENAGADHARVEHDTRLSASMNGTFFHIVVEGLAPAERLRQWRRMTRWFSAHLID